MTADPMPAPVTCGCVAGVVAPVATKTLATERVAFDASLFVRLTVTPPAGAAWAKVTASVADRPNPTVVFETLIPGRVDTFTVATAFAMPAALAVIVADPAATAFTGTLALVAPAAMLTLAGTVALVASLETRFTVKPPTGAVPPLKLSVRFPEAPTVSDNGDPAKAMAGGVTVTVPVPGL